MAALCRIGLGRVALVWREASGTSARAERLPMLKVMIVDDEPQRGRGLARCCAIALRTGVAVSDWRGRRRLPRARGGGTNAARMSCCSTSICPTWNGIEVARHLAQRENPPAVIFVTAYDEHALHAFEVQALDYLMKPVRAERLVSALARAERIRAARTANRRGRPNDRLGPLAPNGVRARPHDPGADRRCRVSCAPN